MMKMFYYLTCVGTLLLLALRWASMTDIDGLSVIYPPIICQSSEIVLNPGDDFQLNCRGNRPVKWTYPTEWAISSKVNISSGNTNRDVAYPFWSTLRMSDVAYSNTGFYHCHYDGTKRMDEGANVSSIYLYVYDENHLFVPMQNQKKINFIPIHQHSDSVIPCRPTHPKVNVTLIKMNPQRVVNVSAESGVQYHPTMGFLVKYPTDFFFGYFECRANYSNTSATFGLHLSYFHVTDSPPNPVIDDSNARHVTVNSTFRLVCRAGTEIETMIFANWTYPESVEPSRVFVSNTTARNKVGQNGFEYREVSSELTVINANITDQGMYKCIMTDHTGKRGQREKFVKVYIESAHISLSSDIHGLLELPARQDKINLVVYVDAFPPPKITWKKEETNLTNGNKYQITALDNKERVSRLTVFNLQKSDTGNYTLVAKSENIEKNFTIKLLVKEAPTINMNASAYIIYYNNSVSITCNGSGSPLPTIRWSYCPYNSPNDYESDFYSIGDGETMVNEPIITQNTINAFTQSSTLKMKADVSGYYQCIVENRIGNITDYVPFIVTDVENGFSIQQSEGDPIDSLKFSLTCGASNLLYKKLTWSWQPDWNSSAEYSLENIEDVEVNKIWTDDSFFVELIFHKLTIMSNGRYTCRASEPHGNDELRKFLRVHSGLTDVQHYDLRVREPERPAFIYTNLNGSTIDAYLNDRLELVCNASGVPTPIVTWKKNNQILSPTKYFDAKSHNLDSILVIPRANWDDKGLYVCIVENIAGEITANITMQIDVEISVIVYAPIIDQSSEIVLNTGDDLQLNCRGNRPVRWTYPIKWSMSSKVNISSGNTNGDVAYPFWSTLRMSNVAYNNTGFYHCRYDGTKRVDEGANVSSIYLYVYDENHLFVPIQNRRKINFIPIHQYSDAVIPCRPTHPKVNVTLIKMNPWRVVNDSPESGVQYHPTMGFLVKYPTNFFFGYFECRANYSNSSATFGLHLSYFHSTDAAPNPTIDDPNGQHVTINSTLHLVCRAGTEIATVIFANWTYPAYVDPSRVFVSDTTARNRVGQNGIEYREISNELTVINAKITDQGMYRCTMIDHNGKRGQREKFVNVYKAPTVSMNASAYIVYYDDLVNITCNGIGSPLPSIRWSYCPYNGPRDYESKFYSIGDGDAIVNEPVINQNTINAFTQSSTLKIKADMSGYYQCIVQNRIGNITDYIPFIVTEVKNGFSIEPSDRDPINSLKFSLTCGASNQLYETLTWSWQPDWNSSAEYSLENIEDVTVTTISTDYSIFVELAFNKLTIMSNGRYTCRASKPYGSDELNNFLKVHAGLTDVQFYDMSVREPEKPAFIYTNLNGSTINANLNQRLELTCNASGVPSPIVTWKKNNQILDRTKYFDAKSPNVNSILVISRARWRDKGRYVCIVENIAGEITADITIQIYAGV